MSAGFSRLAEFSNYMASIRLTHCNEKSKAEAINNVELFIAERLNLSFLVEYNALFSITNNLLEQAV